jgi:hypothetical protein
MCNHDDCYVIIEKVKKQCLGATVIFIEKFGMELIPSQKLMNATYRQLNKQ